MGVDVLVGVAVGVDVLVGVVPGNQFAVQEPVSLKGGQEGRVKLTKA